MGKKLSASEVARFAERTMKRRCATKRRDMRARFRLGVIGLLLSLTLAGCADSAAGSDNDKRGVFYGGVTGGYSRP